MNPELVIDFLNTAGFGPVREDLPTPKALVDWLAARGLEPGARASRADYEEALRVREALRDLLLEHNEVPAHSDTACDVLDRAADHAGLGVRFEGGATELRPKAAGVPGAIGRILALVSEAMADGTWQRMKACRADDCREAFVDTSKNKSRAWCSMEVCGNRAKVHAYRARHS